MARSFCLSRTLRMKKMEKKRYVSFPRGRRRREKGRFMKRKLTRKQALELAALKALPDDEINLSDIPERRDWSKAVVGKFYRPVKKSLTIRLDADVIAWLRAEGPGYQTRLNKVLRSAMKRNPKRRRA